MTTRTVTAGFGVQPALPSRAEPTRAWVVTNAVLMQVGWFACVLGAAHGWPWAGTAVSAAVIGYHLWRAPRRAGEAQLLLAVIAFGAVFDAAMLATGAVKLVNGQWLPWFTAHWMLALWALFGTALNVSLRWLKGRWWLGAAMGAVAGPMSFSAGSRLGAASFTDPTLGLGFLAVGWALAIPALLWLAQRFDGVSPLATADAVNPSSNEPAGHHV